MNAAIMIMMTWMGSGGLGGSSGPHIVTQEYSTMERCVDAFKTMQGQVKDWNAGDKVRTFCVLK
jgi:hypothetical protein